MQPVLLAQSTFRQSDTAVTVAIEKAQSARELLVVFVVDVNLARYLIDSDVGLYDELRGQAESDLLEVHRQQGEETLQRIAERAREQGVSVRTELHTGRFAQVCLTIIEREQPSLVVTTRSRRPAWVRKFFGSPVDALIEQAGCPVLTV